MEGRSKGACVVLGFQDIEGMKHVHTTHLANELVGQAHNICVTKVVNPETAELMSKMYGEYEVMEEEESVTESRSGRSRTVSTRRKSRKAAMPSEIMDIPMPSPETGLTFYALTPSLGAYRETMPGKVVASMLCPANTDPTRGGMANRVPVAAARQKLRSWDGTDYARLKMNPPENETARVEPPDEDPEGPTPGRTSKKLLLLRTSPNRAGGYE